MHPQTLEPEGTADDRRARRRVALATVATVLLPAIVVVLLDHRYYFRGDTQAAYLGWWYHLGEQVRAGHWPVLDVSAWRAGNLAAEGQWGLLSPLTLAIGLLATVVGDVVVLVTVVKLVLLCTGSLGVLALARSYGAPRGTSYVAAVAAPFGGMTVYLDVPSWAAGLMIWALLPWAWWGLRRLMTGESGPVPALVAGYLLVTVGYVYGTIMLVLVLAACLLDSRLARDRAAALRVLGVGVLCGLVALAVYLPGVLTAPVTMRAGAYGSSGKLGSDLASIIASVLPTAVVPGTTAHLLPYASTAWFLPMLLWADPARLRAGWRPLAGLVAVAVVMLAIVVGPSSIGPLRFPLRLQPFLLMALLVLWAVVLGRYAGSRPTRGRLLAALAWVVLAGVLAVVRAPVATAAHLPAVLLVAGALWLAWRSGWRTGHGSVRLLAGLTLVLLALQHAVFSSLPSPERNMPAPAAAYRAPLAQARGDVVVLGDVAEQTEADPAATSDLLVGSAWYLGDRRVQNTYTTISFKSYHDRYCMSFDGSTCPQALATLFAREPSTGQVRADLLGVSTVVLVRADFPARRLASPPPGWRVADRTRHQVTWVRRAPVPGAGRPVWSSPGTRVTPVSSEDRSVRFRVDAVPAGGGRVVLSRMAWPGYRTDLGTLGAKVDGYLLSVDLPASAAGRTVTVRFSPPGWPAGLVAWGLALLAGAAWAVLDLGLDLRGRRRAAQPRRGRSGRGRSSPSRPAR